MNRLASSSSAYLQQHADQPVAWQPWDEQALEQAKTENKPIVLSVGYATCHWCHVMARESFSDPDIAEFMNTHFVNIKVDREERPDLDQIYQEAAQWISRASGWPLNCFLTPEGKPFFAGTYFPPEPEGRLQSWFQALQFAIYNYRSNREAVERQGDRIFKKLTEGSIPPSEPQAFSGLPAIYQKLVQSFDQEFGGFGNAPKYPDFPALQSLMHYAFYAKDASALGQVGFTIDQLLQGGIYDQIGGGLCRYAVDRAWQIPHFEKMLYDNALLIDLLADLNRLRPNSNRLAYLEKTIQFLKDELQHPKGYFFSALDADTEGEEGKFYRWEKDEIDQLLLDRASNFWKSFSLTEGVLQCDNSDHDLDEDLQTLLNYRNHRPKPFRDPKIHIGWNALLASAFIKAGYVEDARLLLDALFQEMNDGVIPHLIGEKAPGFLADYANVIQASLDLFEWTFEEQWLDRANSVGEKVLELFSHPEQSGLLFAPNSRKDLPLNRAEWADLEVPSGNAVMTRNLFRLGYLLDKRKFLQKANTLLDAVRPFVQANPQAHGSWLTLVGMQEVGMDEIAVIGEKASLWARQIHQPFYPNRVLMASLDENAKYPLTTARPANGKTRIYLCRNYACQRPVESLKEFWDQIELFPST